MFIRATSRVTGAAKNTIRDLIREVGSACETFQAKWLRGLTCEHIECGEIWSFCYAKARNVPAELKGRDGIGTILNFVAICRDCKLIPVWRVGRRDLADPSAFMFDLRSRLAVKIQLSTDAMEQCVTGVVRAFKATELDYGMIDKDYSGGGNAKNPTRGTLQLV